MIRNVEKRKRVNRKIAGESQGKVYEAITKRWKKMDSRKLRRVIKKLKYMA